MSARGLGILVVDDDHAIRRLLRIVLGRQAFTVFEAGTVEAALTTAAAVRPDIVILDLGLPDGDGVEVTRRLREKGNTPILILSVRDQEEEKVAALDAGADDYLTKPFGIGELLARTRVLVRRLAGDGAGEPFRRGDLEVDLTRRLVKVAGNTVRLTPTEYEILKTFVQARGKVLTHQQLLRQVWGAAYTAETHILRVNISNLRRKLERDPEHPHYIITESRVGYRMTAAD
jgi:two-component system KDP operon response regulator KdpE